MTVAGKPELDTSRTNSPHFGNTMAKTKSKIREVDGATEFGVKEFEHVLTDREKFMNAMGFKLVKAGHYPDGALWHNADLRISVKVNDEPESIVAQYTREISKKVSDNAKLHLRSALMDAMGLELVSEKDSEGYSTGRDLIVTEA
jgi:hypothetical protein